MIGTDVILSFVQVERNCVDLAGFDFASSEVNEAMVRVDLLG